MEHSRKMPGIVMWVALVSLLGSVSLFADTRLQLVAKPPKLNGGAATPSASPAPETPAAAPAAKPQPSSTATPGSSVTRTVGGDAAAVPSVADTAGSSLAADPTLVALGSLGASNLYFSYLTLGTVADGYVGGSYDPQVAISVANESIFMNTTAKTNLDRMIDLPTLAQEDKDVVAYMVKTYDVLINQAKSLVLFISNQKDDGSAYQKYRTEAWKRIVELFGIK